MRKYFSIFFFQVIFFSSGAQKPFETIVPRKTVVAGEAFQVQYIIRDAEKVSNLSVPAFTHFRFVSGPNKYKGSAAAENGINPVQNFVYTLEAVNPGRFTIHGASITLNGKPVRSNDVIIEVIPKEKDVKTGEGNTRDAASDYFLRPGEDPYEKIRQNLFLKLVVDRTTCFAGEPVMAIFKLYSRLESSSDIVKNPGFYGFTVQDMVNLSDKQINTEVVNGKAFDVHMIRKIQLYPLRAGTFTIDAMEVKNKIEFSRSAINKKTEQEITEGVLGDEDRRNKAENTELFETKMHTDPVVISVKAVPEKNKPGTFSGAVGTFSVDASAVKERLARNEEGVFEVTIRGKGNFTQLNAPAITWPDGIEGFEPVISDSLDKTAFPLTGRRTFRYTFICEKPGLYLLPSVKFSFFNPRNSTYETVSTTAAQVEINNEEKKLIVSAEKKESIAGKNMRASRIAAGIIILLTIMVLIYWISYKEKFTPVVKQEMAASPPADEFSVPVSDLLHASDKEFCTLLHQSVWTYLGNRLGLEGSGMNKEILYATLRREGVDDGIVEKLQEILTKCEMGMFTGAVFDVNKDQMLAETSEAMELVRRSLL